MPTRRAFLRHSALGTFGLLTASAFSRVLGADAKFEPFRGQEIFQRIVDKAAKEKWATLPIGQLMGKIALELKDVPYVGGTLDPKGGTDEVCIVDLAALDCVTFFEDALDMARMLKKGGSTPEALLTEVTYTRYRGGKLGDFTSRLHYTTDWFYDNEQKGVVRILAPELPGAEVYPQKVSIMSTKPRQYPQLAAHPEMVPKIKQFEDDINGRAMKYIPMAKLAAVEPLLQTGDIVGVCGVEAGIDIPHTGLIYKDEAGVAHFMDASSLKRNMKVTVEDGPISSALNWSKRLTGAMFARPLETT